MTTTLPEFLPDWQNALYAVRDCPSYRPTPLRHVNVDGVGGIWLKDESTRFGLGSFKALGGVYAVMELVRDRHAEREGVRPSIAALFEQDCRSQQAGMCFVCASAGNHGVAVASGAALVGARARIHLCADVPEDFATRLRAQGAEVVRSGQLYEDSLNAAMQDAKNRRGTLVADTAWPGYVDIPARIMAGYTVIGEELREAFEKQETWPSDVYLQAGVGGLAGALTWSIRNRWVVQPRIVIVEPSAAACLASSQKTGKPETVAGPVSSMGRLDCKSASPLAVQALLDSGVDYFQLSDADAETAVQVLAGHGFATTPSGCAGLAACRLEHQSGSCTGRAPLVIISEGSLG